MTFTRRLPHSTTGRRVQVRTGATDGKPIQIIPSAGRPAEFRQLGFNIGHRQPASLFSAAQPKSGRVGFDVVISDDQHGRVLHGQRFADLLAHSVIVGIDLDPQPHTLKARRHLACIIEVAIGHRDDRGLYRRQPAW